MRLVEMIFIFLSLLVDPIVITDGESYVWGQSVPAWSAISTVPLCPSPHDQQRAVRGLKHVIFGWQTAVCGCFRGRLSQGHGGTLSLNRACWGFWIIWVVSMVAKLSTALFLSSSGEKELVVTDWLVVIEWQHWIWMLEVTVSLLTLPQ